MKKITVGILAHVDAGKTTLSEGLLFCAGEIRKLGRVDKKDTFLDTDEFERARGITVFSKQAVFSVSDTKITLLDTPGHTDFTAEAERTLSVLDYAILVISATDGIQSHTKTVWEMLKNHQIPTFIFVNKLDLENADFVRVTEELKEEFSDCIIDFTQDDEEKLLETIAVCDEKLMNGYLESGKIEDEDLCDAIAKRKIFPLFSGSALKLEGVEIFLDAFLKLTKQPKDDEKFGAKVFKISADERGQRLTFVKITGGVLKVKELIDGEKVNEIRIYSGEKYTGVKEADAGTICALTGLDKTFAGQGIGKEGNSKDLICEPIFSYKVILPKGTDILSAVEKFKVLEQEETKLGVFWNEQLKEIQLKLMGEIQTEVLKNIVLKRFGLDVDFEESGIVYKETIQNIVEGVGHFEPLRHYAEVHLVLEPLSKGSGMQFATDCSEEILDKNWQRLILTHLMEKEHKGVLTGAPITDIKITLKSGKAHLKHTEGGDFREATYRAVRHGLRNAKSVLLAPYYDFSLEVPKENAGRAMTDLDQLGATISLPQTKGDMIRITGSVEAVLIRNYHKELVNYTHGQGKISVKFSGYGPCNNQDLVIEETGYNPDADLENTADSVFCSHGAGFVVSWNDVTQHMHLDSVLKPKKQTENFMVKQEKYHTTDKELLRIFEKTYGKVETKIPQKALNTKKEVQKIKIDIKKKPDIEYLLVDGYNIIFAWDDLKETAKENLEDARCALIDKMITYRTYKQNEIIVVFDAYKVKGNVGEVEKIKGITVVYTKEAQTADAYIEKAAKELSKNYKVTVATSDSLEQMIVFGGGALRISAKGFKNDVENALCNIRKLIKDYNVKETDADFFKIIKEKLEELKNQKN